MKFLHCADIHLDSPLRGLVQYEGAPVEEIRGATRRAFENLIELAIDESVSAVVIAGDMYDGDRDDYNTAMFLQPLFGRLKDKGIPVVIVYGNHDAANEITKRLRPPDNVTILSHNAAETVELSDAGIAFHGQSYPSRVVTDDLSSSYPPPIPGMLNVGVLHTSLAGHEGPHAKYAPCTENGLADHGYQYWALGHVHERYATERDGSWIVYPGNLQGRHVRELGPKGATIVTYDGDQVSSVEHRTIDVVRWSHCEVDVAGIRHPDEVVGRAIEQLQSEVELADGRLVAARVTFIGQTEIVDDLISTQSEWEAQLRADAAGAEARVWIERVRVKVSGVASADESEGGEAIGAIQAAISEVAVDEGARRELASAFLDLKSKLGGDLGALEELGLPSLSEDGVEELLPDVEVLLLAKLQGRER